MAFKKLLNFLLFITIIDKVISSPIHQNYSTNDFDDDFYNIDPEELYLSCKPLCDPNGTKTKVKFYLHTRENLTPELRQELIIGNSESIIKSNFNPEVPTRFVVHGWTQSYSAKTNERLKTVFLEKAEYNIIVVDWGVCAQKINYFASRCCVDNVGEQIAELIDFLNAEHHLQFKDLELIGLSLGAHCVGFAGKNVKNGRIPAIIGLDPAKPCFKTDATHERLAATDADYVETIHTNGNILGFFDPIGTASFYPNGGKRQPGCFEPICSHGRSHEFYVESISDENRFIPKKCATMNDLRFGKCNIPVDDIKMGGEHTSHKKAEGIYFLPTKSSSPYGVGELF